MRVYLQQSCLAVLMALFSTLPQVSAAADAPAGKASYEQLVGKAIEYLRTKGQSADGSFSAQAGPAVTALVATGVMRNGRSPEDPIVAKALKYLENFVHADGGIYGPDSGHRNYETCVAILCFAEANKDKRYDKILKQADAYVKGLQWDEAEGHDRSSVNYGGAGYGGSKRPDLSNTGFLMDALKAAGNGPDDEAVKKALIFVSRCQNLESEHNTTEFAAKNPDGGFYYTVAGGGASMAGKTDNGGLRSYGSMTYSGLKSMIFAGVKADDPRVKAAVTWVRKHYDLDENPGMGGAGLYYYYNTFAKALAAMGQDKIEDAEGKTHVWRQELIEALAARQRSDGSWVNETAKWLEGDTNLVTGYALLALSYCRPAPAK